MVSENGLDVKKSKDAFINHWLGSACRFLCRLENLQNPFIQGWILTEGLRKSEQQCHVSIVTTSVHLSFMAGRMGIIRRFLNWQGIHIRSKCKVLGLTPFTRGDNPCFGYNPWAISERQQHLFK